MSAQKAVLAMAVVGALGVAAAVASAKPKADKTSNKDFLQNHYAHALRLPEAYNKEQLYLLSELLEQSGFVVEATNILDMAIGLYGEEPPLTLDGVILPDITFIPSTEIDAIADEIEREADELEGGNPPFFPPLEPPIPGSPNDPFEDIRDEDGNIDLSKLPDARKERKTYTIKADGTDWPWQLAKTMTGDATRWPEICAANPQLERHPKFGCVYPPAGSQINLPLGW